MQGFSLHAAVRCSPEEAQDLRQPGAEASAAVLKTGFTALKCIVQEGRLRRAEVGEAGVDNAAAYLSRLVTNLWLDQLRTPAAKREHYVGVWLPEPVLDDDELFGWTPGPEAQAEYAEDVSVAVMLTLQRLSPLERAAFLLHDVFDLDCGEISHHLGRSEATCRQLKIIAAILERPVIEKILTHLGLAPRLPPRGRAREAAHGIPA
jgi:hypothetical protein